MEDLCLPGALVGYLRILYPPLFCSLVVWEILYKAVLKSFSCLRIRIDSWYFHIVVCFQLLNPVQLLCDSMEQPHQAPLSMGFPRQGYWSGLPFPSPGDLPDPGVRPRSPALQTDSLPLNHLGTPSFHIYLLFRVFRQTSYSPQRALFLT